MQNLTGGHRLPTKEPMRMTNHRYAAPIFICAGLLATTAAFAAPVPSYVPPVQNITTPTYADDTRGVYVPEHSGYRMRNSSELQQAATAPQGGNNAQMVAQATNSGMNRLSGFENFDNELNRIAADPGMLQGGRPAQMPMQSGGYDPTQLPGQAPAFDSTAMPPANAMAPNWNMAPAAPAMPTGPVDFMTAGDGADGVELATGAPNYKSSGVDMHNTVVKLREDRISIRRALQRMMDQVGAGTWAVVWDLDEQNAGLPDMEISIYAEEPFLNVMNALLARVQTRSGQPLRVIRYDRTQRLVVTDRAPSAKGTSSVGVEAGKGPAVVTENVLREAMVSLHFDEIPLADALENMVNQAGQGQWRLRMYAGTDQVLKPAHVEEPFSVALERVLKLFNLKFEIFPGGRLIVVTQENRFGFRGVQ